MSLKFSLLSNWKDGLTWEEPLVQQIWGEELEFILGYVNFAYSF